MKMGLFRCLVVAAMLISTTSFAQNKAGHKINGYKYLCMEEQGNLHDLEDMFNAFFAEIGFTILTPDDEEELRAFYVAMTRAKKHLYLMKPSIRMSYAGVEDARISHYLQGTNGYFNVR